MAVKIKGLWTRWHRFDDKGVKYIKKFPYPHYGQPAFLSKVRVFIYSSGVFVSGTIKMFANSAKTIQIGTTQTIPNGAVTVPILYDLTIPANTVITEGVFVEIANTNGIYAYGRVFIETISI